MFKPIWGLHFNYLAPKVVFIQSISFSIMYDIICLHKIKKEAWMMSKEWFKLGLFLTLAVLAMTGMFGNATFSAATSRQMENIDRGVVAVKVGGGVFVSWRILGTESSGVTYNLYRGSTKIASNLAVGNYVDVSGTAGSVYSVAAVVNGGEQTKSTAVSVWSNNYLAVPLQVPAGGTINGTAYTYSANDCSVADLDGDHQYEIVVKWDPSNSKDNSQSGYTGNVYLDAYEMNGARLWRIDLGRNIRAGAHYTQFMVYDLDGDGKAEVACKIADGTVDGQGNTFGSVTADYHNSSGYILSGNEYLGLFSGNSGRLLKYVGYQPPRGTVGEWGDSYGNRVDRFLACVAYLDGARPSLVMCRGYYTRTVLVAWDYRDGNLTRRWIFDSNSAGSAYQGQGNHNLSVGDVDNDGKDEIVYGAMTVDDDGRALYNTKLGHGDAMHLGDLNPNRYGLEVWQCHEGGNGATFRDAATGSVIFKYNSSGDVGRACAADIDSNYAGEEVWASGSALYSCTGTVIGTAPSNTNFAIWWDGDLQRELLDGTMINKWVRSSNSTSRLVTGSDSPYNAAANNGTKNTPCLTADLFGDWREEVIWRTADSRSLIIATTTYPTNYRIYTLMHDPVYRLGVAWQNVAYNQPPHTGFYLGGGMTVPPANPNIYLTN
jgi:rhamnogalacturonan endolyase